MIDSQLKKVSDGLKMVRIALNLSQSEFADTIKYKQNTVSQNENGGKDGKGIAFRYIEKVCEVHKVNIDWLLERRGEMFLQNGNKKPDETDTNDNQQDSENVNGSNNNVTIINPAGEIVKIKPNRRKGSNLIPFYNADFMAGNAEIYYEDDTIYPEYYMDVPEFAGCIAFRAYSDSMETKIKSGSILFGTKIDEWRKHLELGQIYGITTTDGRRYLKYIRRHDEDHKNYFLLKSENPNYDDFEIPKKAIKNIWQIEGWLNKNT